MKKMKKKNIILSYGFPNMLLASILVEKYLTSFLVDNF